MPQEMPFSSQHSTHVCVWCLHVWGYMKLEQNLINIYDTIVFSILLYITCFLFCSIILYFIS